MIRDDKGRRRLEPLRLEQGIPAGDARPQQSEESRSSKGVHSAGYSSAPAAVTGESRGPTEPRESPAGARSPAASRFAFVVKTLVIVALSLAGSALMALGALWLFGADGWWDRRNASTTSTLPRTSVPVTPIASAALPASVPDAASCEAPCCGGSACRVTAENRRGNPEQCKAGSTMCNRCPSGWTCISGACSEFLRPGEEWELHLSAVSEGGPNPSKDTCRSFKDAWIRLRVSGSTTWTDIPLADPCSHGGRAERGMPILTEDLTSTGLDIEVRHGSPEGRLLASADSLKNPRGFLRRALCRGMKLSSPDAGVQGSVAFFTFYLDPRP